MAVIDGKGAVVGRLASVIAKRLLKGEEIVVVNAEHLLLSGNLESNYKEYFDAYNRGKAIRGPYFPRMPDRIFRRTVRGMLPFRTKRGRDAYRRLKVYIGTPRGMPTEGIEKTEAPKRGRKYIELGKISEMLGARLGK